jgi:hypothetical protein
VCEESLETRKVGVISDKYTSRKIPLKEVKVIQMLKFPWRFFFTVGSGAVAVANKVRTQLATLSLPGDTFSPKLQI